jgi:nitroreductase
MPDKTVAGIESIFGGTLEWYVCSMNPKLSPIFSRRSVRRYTGAPVTDEQLRDLLEAAMAAPSAAGKDPWHFIVVRDQEMLKRVAENLPYGKFIVQAGMCIIVCGDLERAHANEHSYMTQDCSAAIENLMIAATILGLGTCWLGVHPREDRVQSLITLFKLPKNIVPLSGIAVGWPAEIPAPRTRYRQEAIHADKW